MKASCRESDPKEARAKKRENKGKEATKEAHVWKTKSRKPTIVFGPTEVVKEKPMVFKECVVGFAIRVDKGNNTKQAFDKKLMEGLESFNSTSTSVRVSSTRKGQESQTNSLQE